VAVDAASGDAHAPAFLRSLAIATVRRQRTGTAAAGTTNSPTKGAAAGKSTARRRGIHLQLT